MNLNIIFHLLRTDVRREIWIIVAFLLGLFLSNYFFLAAIIGILLIAKIAQEDNLVRTTAHWRVRPVSGRDWAVGKALFILLVILGPVAIKQGWDIGSTGFSRGTIMRAVAEACILSLAVASLTFALSSGSPTWKRLVILGAVILFSFPVIIYCIGSFLSFSQSPLKWTSAASKTPNPFPWFFIWLVFPFAITVWLLLLARSGRSWKWFLIVCLSAVGIFIVTIDWWESNAYRFNFIESESKARLITGKGDPANDQQLFQDLNIAQLPPGAFVEMAHLTASSLRRPGDYSYSIFVHPQTGEVFLNTGGRSSKTINLATDDDKAVLRLFEQDEVVLTQRYSYTVPSQVKSLHTIFNDDGPLQVEVRGEMFQWQKLGEMRFSEGASFLADGIVVKIEKMKAIPADEFGKSFHVTAKRTLLESSPYLNESHLKGRWKGITKLCFIAYHEKLKETVLLTKRIITAPELQEYESAFQMIQRTEMDISVQNNAGWRILWPKDEVADPVSKWLSGARLQIYTLKYLGRFDDTIQLPARK